MCAILYKLLRYQILLVYNTKWPTNKQLYKCYQNYVAGQSHFSNIRSHELNNYVFKNTVN